MCGLAGFWQRNRQFDRETCEHIISQMCDVIKYRGPDSKGYWQNSTAEIVLGHRRLAILDLSPNGAQPMSSADGRFHMVYNGEIYNHLEIRKELQKSGHTFRGHSDTETMLACFAEWGLEESFKRFNGMFACAIFDQKLNQLTLLRDRMGIKPLYYGTVNDTFAFASELKPFRQIPNFNASINRDALDLYMAYGYIPAPYSIYNGIYKISPGTYITLPLSANSQQSVPRDNRPLPEKAYWSFDEVATQKKHSGMAHGDSSGNPLQPESYQHMVDHLHSLLLEATKIRMLADVPLGAFLSGGIDSSLVVSLMQRLSGNPIKTFTIGFEEKEYNEAIYAKEVASHLKTNHTELIVTPQQMRDVIPLLPEIYDEPFADSSQVPTYLVSQLAKQHVTVSLSGDGGDELFCGYRRYYESLAAYKKLEKLPFRTELSAILKMWQRLPGALRFGKNLSYLAEKLSLQNADEVYRKLLTHWPAGGSIVLGGDGSSHQIWDTTKWQDFSLSQEKWMWIDTKTYLPDDILTKVDRASMAVSLEARVPLLDYHVVEYAWQIPVASQFGYAAPDAKGSPINGKKMLKSILSEYIPQEMLERKKMGFGVPIDAWLRGPLKEWASDLLQPDKLKQEGYLNETLITKRWEDHLEGRADWHYSLWNVLMFEAWLAQNS